MATLFDYPNVTGIDDMLMYTNDVTDGFLGIFLLFAIFAGITITSLNVIPDFDRSVMVGAWGTTLLAVLFFGLGLISETVLVACVIATGGGTFFALTKRY